MADIRIKDLATTATTTASDDFMAVDGVTNGTRKLSAATPAFLTSVTTPSLTAPASTNLTLAGGTAGSDSVVVSNTLAASSAIIGAFKVGNNTPATNVAIGGGNINAGGTGTFGGVLSTTGGSDLFQLNATSGNGVYLTLKNSGTVFGYIGDAGSLITSYSANSGTLGFRSQGAISWATAGATEKMSLSTGGALVVTGTVSTTNSTASTGVGTGALQVAGGIYAGAASVFGSTATFAGDVSVTRTGGAREVRIATTTSGAAGFYAQGYSSATTVTGTAGGELVLWNQDATANTFGAVTNLDAAGNTTSRIRFINESDANNTGSIVFATRPSGGSLTDALTLASTGAATFAGAVTASTAGNTAITIESTDAATGVPYVRVGYNSNLSGQLSNDAATGKTYLDSRYNDSSSAVIIRTKASSGTPVVNATFDSTGAVTFAGAVTVAGTVIHTLSATPASASATGTVGTISWDASYIYICTAANTWKRVAIATW